MLPAFVSLALVVAASITWVRPAAAAELTFNTHEFAPFTYTVNGVASGPVVDVTRRVCAAMKIECPMQVLPWRRGQEEVAYDVGFAQKFADPKLVEQFNATFRTLPTHGVIQVILGRDRMEAAALE